MALTHCPDCKKEVSTRAATCPNCGAPMPVNPELSAEKNKNAGAVMFRVFFWIVAAAIILYLLNELIASQTTP